MLGQILNSKEALAQSVKNVTSNYQGKLDELQRQNELLNERKRQLELGQSRLIEAIVSGIIGKAEVQSKMSEIRRDRNLLESEIAGIEEKICNLSVDLPDDVMDRLQKIITALIGRGGRNPMTWPLEEKVKLARFFFGFGRKDLGVFIKTDHDDLLGEYKSFEIIGTLGSASGAVSGYPSIDDRDPEIHLGQIDLPGLQQLVERLDPDNLPTKAYKSPVKTMALAISRKRMQWS